MTALIYGMVYLGAALMVWNIIRYARYIKRIRQKGEWRAERGIINFALILLIMFLAGYLVVGFFGRPSIVMAAILFFGSVFVAIIVELLERVTNRVQKNEQLEAKLIAAEESNKAKTNFLSSMSHEIRTPMNAILGLDTLALNDPDLPPQTREKLEKIDISARHMLLLINDILDMSRIESGKVELNKTVFSFKSFIIQINTMIKAQCDERHLTFKYELI